jgi:outer membrane protein OmpA-like peptidoglycan-associated protein
MIPMNPSCRLAFAALIAVGCAAGPSPKPFQSPDSPALTGTTTFPPDMGRGASRSETEVTMMYLPVEIQHSCDGTDPKFTFDSSGVEMTDSGSLRNLAACMKDGALKNRSIRIIGHADARGSEGYNDRLGKRRAESVKLTLEKMGVPPDRLITVTDGKLGATLPTEDWDRRVDFQIVE